MSHDSTTNKKLLNVRYADNGWVVFTDLYKSLSHSKTSAQRRYNRLPNYMKEESKRVGSDTVTRTLCPSGVLTYIIKSGKDENLIHVEKFMAGYVDLIKDKQKLEIEKHERDKADENSPFRLASEEVNKAKEQKFLAEIERMKKDNRALNEQEENLLKQIKAKEDSRKEAIRRAKQLEQTKDLYLNKYKALEQEKDDWKLKAEQVLIDLEWERERNPFSEYKGLYEETMYKLNRAEARIESLEREIKRNESDKLYKQILKLEAECQALKQSNDELIAKIFDLGGEI